MARSNPVLAMAEETMIEAWRLLQRLPDRERGWLRSGQRGAWFDMVKDRQADYADHDAAPRLQLGRREVAKVERAFLAELCLAEAVPPAHLRLFATVIAAKAGRLPGGFKWQDIGARLYGRSWGTARCDATTDTLRSRYEACLGRVAVRMAVMEQLAAA